MLSMFYLHKGFWRLIYLKNFNERSLVSLIYVVFDICIYNIRETLEYPFN